MPDADVSESDVVAAKRALRSRMRAVRRAAFGSGTAGVRSGDVAERFSVAVEPLRPRRVLGYDAVPGEVETSVILDWCRSLGAEVVVVEPHPDAPLPVAVEWPDLILVPGLAFDHTGGRLGQGGGWYDRLLADRHEGCAAIGLCLEECWVDRVPTEPHDQRVDAVVTEVGATWFVDRGSSRRPSQVRSTPARRPDA